MLANASPMSVGDFCNDLKANKITINDDYQRNSGLWSSLAKSYFIESILLEFPIPKLFVYARIDLKTKGTIKEIVDGQQRSGALRDFFNNKLRLSQKIDTDRFRGKRYSDLEDDDKSKFLGYSLPIDQFSGVQEAEVREAFTRMNANNVPLNEEEQRNARFQGPFKWFVNSLCKEKRERFLKIGLFSKRDLIRMGDFKLVADLAYLVDNGIHTTKSAQLDAIYKKYNTSFDREGEFQERLGWGIDTYLSMDAFHDPRLAKPYMAYSIISALIDRKYQLAILEQARNLVPEIAAKVDAAPVSLDDLIVALGSPEDSPQLADFVQTTTKTNVDTSRAARMLYFDSALQNLDA
ncbi:DUF262 domain-containing protein [Bradyrhizobium sp. CNPSo 4010]|uniref:DUF262 domain-containing protein n=1 Tax=Bradyrhizobium agreste TaxID=2751811 RepID=A0ABS0PMJ6_9BRAD|nr:DUF262 domain-containing protein [Bradyrhizobium agreste]MBH5398439.1 DUF262 domain-containing protein [Bradyrhizobium agreste]